MVIIDVTERRDYVIVNEPAKLQAVYDRKKSDIWVGFNSRDYDQYILKGILLGFNPKEINDWIIVDGKKGWQFSSLFRKIPINNFDVMPQPPISLKALEAFMGHDIQETSVPFNIDRHLTKEELADTIKYCRHDVEETVEVFMRKKEEFDSHMSLIKTFSLPLSYIGKTKAQLSAIILGAEKRDHNDEFEITIPDTLRIEKYTEVLNWYLNPLNRDYDKTLEIDVSGVPHVFAWGGLHGAIPKYSEEGYFLHVDVGSYYPSLMLRYDFISRNVSNPAKYRDVYNARMQFKKEKNPMQKPYKIVLNATYGAMKDKNNGLYDPMNANNVCVGGQLLLLDLIEKLEGHCQLIQSNTDGLIVKLFSPDDFETIDDICYEWETRTGMTLEFDEYQKVFQKDVNNYIVVDLEGEYESKGAYVKQLSPLDYDLPIVNEATVAYMLHGVRPEETIGNCSDLQKFQKVVKVSSKYLYGLYSPTITEKKIRDEKNRSKTIKVFEGGEIQTDKTFRVFASNRERDGGLFKVSGKKDKYGRSKNPEKFGNTPDHCFFINGNVEGVSIPDRLDRTWYINLTWERLTDFGVVK